MRRSAAGQTVLAALFFLLATIVLTWPIAPRAADGLADIWDAKLNAWILHWDYHQTLRDPIHLFDANIFYPSRYALAFSENLYGAALFGFPLYAAGASTLLTYNVVFLLGMFLSAFAAWFLAREVTGDPLAAVVAGLVYAFCPWRIAQIPHIQFQWGAFLVLALLFLLRYLDGGQRRDLVLFGVSFAWNACCNVHYALFSGFLVLAVLLYEGLASGGAVFRRRLAGVAVAIAIAGVIVLPLYVPYALASSAYGMERGYGEIEAFSGEWRDFLTAGGQNKVYGRWTQKWAKTEGEFFPGVVPVILAGVAVAKRRRPEGRLALAQAGPGRRRWARVLDLLLVLALAVWIASIAGRTAVGTISLRDPGRVLAVATLLLFARLAIAFPRWSRFAHLADFLRRARFGTRAGLFVAIGVLGVVIAMGTHTPYYRFLVQSFGPVFRVIRAPSRGIVLFEISLGVLAAWGLAELLRGATRARRLLFTAATVVAMGFEFRAFPYFVWPVDPRPGVSHASLARVHFEGGVVEWPMGTPQYDPEHEFRSTAHWKPILNGYSGFAPPSYVALASTMAERPIPGRVWDMLRERKATLLLFHPGQVEGDEAVAYADGLLQGMEANRIELLQSLEADQSGDFLFRLTTGPPLDWPRPSKGQATLERARLAAVRRPPFGYVDVPAEGEPVASGRSGLGWALDDSGVSRVTVAFDDGPAQPVTSGLAHPGPPQVYPGYPGVGTAGFTFAIPPLSPGVHTLTVTIVARDGGKTLLRRGFVAR